MPKCLFSILDQYLKLGWKVYKKQLIKQARRIQNENNMARVNIGICPRYLSDQHLIAESVEITMITGGLRKNGHQIKSEIPDVFNIGKGHINFFKNKLYYLNKRLLAVNKELGNRNIRHSTKIDLNEFPSELRGDWKPDMEDSKIIRFRVFDRLNYPLKARKGFHRYYKNPIENIHDFSCNMLNSELFEV